MAHPAIPPPGATTSRAVALLADRPCLRPSGERSVDHHVGRSVDVSRVDSAELACEVGRVRSAAGDPYRGPHRWARATP